MISRITQGLGAGYAATAVMDASQTTVIPAISSWAEGYLSQEQGEQQEGPSEGQAEESSPVKVARRGASFLGVELNQQGAETWGNRVHWAYGIGWGIAYPLFYRRPGLRSGLTYGAGLWLGSDELLLWGLGVAKAPSQYPPKTHFQALAAHLVYGVTLGLLARGIRG